MYTQKLSPQIIEDVIAFNWDVTPSVVGNKTLKALSGAIKKLAQALSEAVDNIIDEGGNLAEIFVKNSKTSGRFDIFIRDNGAGLNLNKIQNMFKIGSSSSSKGHNTMGWKGVGIKAAAHATSEKFWVIGREKGGELVSAFMDFTINVDNWADKQFSNVFSGEDVYNNTPRELLELIPSEKDFVGCIQMFNNIKKRMVQRNPDVTSVVKKLLQCKSSTSRNSLSYIYREILNKEIKITVNGQHLISSGHGHESTPDGKPLSHRYFRNQHPDGERVYTLIGPDGLSWDITVFYTLSFKFDEKNAQITKVTSTPNQGEIHLLRNGKEVTTCKIPIPSYGNNYAIGELHVDVHMSPKFIDEHSELASNKTLESLSAIGPDDYNFGKILVDLLRRDLDFAIQFNRVNFLSSSNDARSKKTHHPEFIYRDRYYEFLRENYLEEGTDEVELKNIVIKEDSNGIYGTRNDLTDNGKIVEIKVQADQNSIGQCLNYMTQRKTRECRLISIACPKNLEKFEKFLKESEDHYNVKIDFVNVSNRKKNRFLHSEMMQELTPEEHLALKKFKNKKK